MEQIEIWTDGGCHGNPGPGAWAFVITENGIILSEECGGEKLTTNNRMELSAVINALQALNTRLRGRCGGSAPAEGGSRRAPAALCGEGGDFPPKITIYTDSEYVKNGITAWIFDWKANGWRTASKKPVKNQDLWQQLDALAAELPLHWQWVRGHSGNALNERCDALTQKAIENL